MCYIRLNQRCKSVLITVAQNEVIFKNCPSIGGLVFLLGQFFSPTGCASCRVGSCALLSVCLLSVVRTPD